MSTETQNFFLKSYIYIYIYRYPDWYAWDSRIYYLTHPICVKRLIITTVVIFISRIRLHMSHVVTVFRPHFLCNINPSLCVRAYNTMHKVYDMFEGTIIWLVLFAGQRFELDWLIRTGREINQNEVNGFFCLLNDILSDVHGCWVGFS